MNDEWRPVRNSVERINWGTGTTLRYFLHATCEDCLSTTPINPRYHIIPSNGYRRPHPRHGPLRHRQGLVPARLPRPQTPKNLAISLSIEAAEVLELFQWSEKQRHPDELASELADVMLYLLQLARLTGIDLETAVIDKLKINYRREWDQHLIDESEQNGKKD